MIRNLGQQFPLMYIGSGNVSITFMISLTQPEPLPAKREAFTVDIKVWREDLPENTWEWSGTLGQNKVDFNLVYQDEINIKGSFMLFASAGTGDSYLFADISFGKNYEELFEGNVVQLQNEASSPIPPVG